MSRRKKVTICVLGVGLILYVCLRFEDLRHSWYHHWTEPRRFEQAHAFARSLGSLITTDDRYSEVQWFARVRPHNDPVIEFRGNVPSEEAMRDLQTAVNAAHPRFEVVWEISVTNNLR